ncbi:hypothetical protein BDZ45DRAFT_738897 [Acephala macrosclerotiorum]|nr:hypothetical protein BDZ45DRAFT_738897 [Acephala macrosclerotiorum]
MGGKTSGLLLAFGARGGASDPEDLVHFCCQKLRVWFMNQSSYAKAVGRIRASARQRSAVSRSQSTDKGWNLVTTKSHVAQEMIGLLRMASAKLMEMMLKGERDTGSTCTKTPGLSALKNQKTGTFPRTKFGPGMRTMEMPWTSRYAGSGLYITHVTV